MLAKEIMTKKVKTVVPRLSIKDFAAFLISEHISGAPVVDAQGAFLGVATEEDLIFQDKKVTLPMFLNLFANIFPVGIERTEEELKKIAGTRVEDIMQRHPLSVTSETSIEDIATLMSEKKQYYFPVIDAGKLAGVITKRDVIRAVAKGSIW